MPSLVYEENTKVVYLPTIAAVDLEPTVAEIAAGTDVTSYITKDGINEGASNNRVASGTIDTAFDAEEPGSYGFQLSLTAERDDTDDDFFDLFVRGLRGYILISDTASVAATEKCRVYPVAAMSPEFPASAANTKKTVTVPFAVTAPPNLRAVIAAT